MLNTTKDYHWLKFNGSLSVVPVTPGDIKREHLLVSLLMGPTGSGKSAFIETVSADQKLDISKDTLESVTKEVVCYRVVNLTQLEQTVILMDTPGFLDTMMSESRITKMIMETLDSLRQSAKQVTVCMLYFQPITDIRMGRSKRDAVQLLRAFANSFGASGVNVVTTMWNQISSPEKMEDANRRFHDLDNEIFRLSEFSIDVTKFELSSHSALSILDNLRGGWYHNKDKSQKTDPLYKSLVLNNILERISNIQQHLLTLAQDKQNASTPGRENPLLLEAVLMDEKVALHALQSFLDDLYEIDPETYMSLPLPPLPLRVTLKHQFRHFVVTGKRIFRKHK